MRKKTIVRMTLMLLMGTIMILGPGHSPAQIYAQTPEVITLDFDNIDTSATGVALLSNEFQSQGVLFTQVNPDGSAAGPAVVVRDGLWGNGAVSLPNSVAFGYGGTIVKVAFVDPVTGSPAVTDFVSAQVGDRSGEPDPITLTAFGLNGEILGTSSFTSLYSGHFGQVSISVAGIHRVEFSDASPSGADFDDFNYHRLAAEITVATDIKPGSFPNSINPKSQGTIPVAVLSAADFNAPQEVDPASLTFGRIGDEKSLVKVNNSSEDVNGDGLPDLVAHFDTRKTGFQPGDTEGILKGKTRVGIVLKGQDSVRVLGGS